MDKCCPFFLLEIHYCKLYFCTGTQLILGGQAVRHWKILFRNILCLFNDSINDRQFCLSSPPPVGWQCNFIGSLSVDTRMKTRPTWPRPGIDLTPSWSLSFTVSNATTLIHSATESVYDYICQAPYWFAPFSCID